MMRKKIFSLLFLLAGCGSSLLAQQHVAENMEARYYKTGMELLEKGKYGAARQMFEKYLEHAPNEAASGDASYYIAYSAIGLYHADGEKLMDEFVREYETHPKAVTAYYEMGSYYFREKDYTRAIKYFEQVEVPALTKELQTETRFKLAYSYFSKRNFAKAKQSFDLLKSGTHRYTYAANYYAGFIAYRDGSYDEALRDLRKAEENEAYAAIVPYMIMNVYYKQRDYDRVISYSKELENSNKDLRNEHEIFLLTGEAYFRQEKYEQAVEYFEAYQDASRGVADEGAQYRLAYAQYRIGKNEKAIDNFKKVAVKNDTLSQLSSYYLGMLYVKEDNKQYALSAFDKARQSNLSDDIRENAGFNYAKVLMELGNYSQAIKAIQDFQKDFGQSRYRAESDELLGEAFLNTSDYDQAINHLEKTGLKSKALKTTYQKVTFLKGTQLFNAGKFFNAVEMFKKSLANAVDKEYEVMAHFWSGEAYSIGKKYDEAINSYSAVFRNASYAQQDIHLKSRYGIAYAYFNTRAYDKALPHFKEYVTRLENAKEKLFYEDALIRLADSYYANKEYQDAIRVFQKAIQQENPEVDYAYYQKGVIHGMQNEYEPARQHLKTVVDRFPKSRYIDNTLFEMAQLDFEQGKYDEAIRQYSNLIKEKPQSPFVPYALQNRAVAYANLGNFDNTIKDYQQILDKHISHPVANGALLGLQDALTQEGKAQDFEQYLSKYREANPDDASLSSVEFESAKNLYFNQKYDKAIEGLQAYIDQYPEGGSVTEAQFYLGDAHFRQERDSEALEYFYQVVNEGTGSFRNRALQRIGDIELERNSFSEAIIYYGKLASAANNKREQYNAWSGLMTAYYELSNYDSAGHYANEILERGNVNVNAENNANLFLGKSAYAQGEMDAAKDYFQKTLNTARDEFGAEAQFLLAEIQHTNGNYKKSIETLYELNNNFSVFEYWIGRSFLLIADNYIALDENFQARATLNSLIENSPLEDIKAIAGDKLRTIEKQEEEEQIKQRAQEDTTEFEIIENE